MRVDAAKRSSRIPIPRRKGRAEAVLWESPLFPQNSSVCCGTNSHLGQTFCKCRHTHIAVQSFYCSEYKQRVRLLSRVLLVTRILLWVEDQKWGLGSSRVGSTYTEGRI